MHVKVSFSDLAAVEFEQLQRMATEMRPLQATQKKPFENVYILASPSLSPDLLLSPPTAPATLKF